jgi:heme A synthase
MLEHRVSQVAVLATFVLLLVGGTVNPTGSSLACPEPTLVCNGELFPHLSGGVLYEHGHRLVAMTVGLLQIFLTVLLWRRRPAMRPLAALALFLVCAQGALGAVTVKFQLPWAVSTAHLLMAMLYLAVLLYSARKTAPEPVPTPRRAETATRVLPWIGAAALLLLLQILLGGLVRHHEAALASIQLPLHDGQLWPANAPLALKLHIAHRLAGVMVGIILIAASVAVYHRASGWPAMRRLAAALPLLVLAQIGLGLWVIVSFRAVAVAVVHFGGAALLWSMVTAMWWRAWCERERQSDAHNAYRSVQLLTAGEAGAR